jgi:hypothetical protein
MGPWRPCPEVKVIDFNGMIRNLDWHPVYQALESHMRQLRHSIIHFNSF